MRSHQAYEVKKNIAFLYKFDQNAYRKYIEKNVTELLKRDRYTCAGSHGKVCVNVE